jgi:hypothetical protein
VKVVQGLMTMMKMLVVAATLVVVSMSVLLSWCWWY